MTEKVKKMRGLILGALLLAVLGGGSYWWLHARHFESTDNAYVRAEIIALSPRVGGEILAKPVHNNQPVKKGELLLSIDRSDYEARLANARAQVAVREAALAANTQQKAMQGAMIEEARASERAAQADEARLHKDYERADRLVAEGVATHQRLDSATAAYKSATAGVARTQAGVKAAREQSSTIDAERRRLDAELQAAHAMLRLAELDLAATEIRAPVDGVIGDLSARVGERVAAGTRLLSVVPLADVFVEANFKETQLTLMSVGQSVEIEVDAFPGQVLRGHIDSLSPASGAEFALLPADNATGNFNKIVQRVPVKILLDDRADLAGRLRPGMSVEVSVDTRTAPLSTASVAP